MDRYIFIYTNEMLLQLKNIIAAAGIEAQTVKILVDAVSLADIKTKLVQYGFNEQDEYIVNVTGGTKIMSLGVYQYFSQFPKAGIYYLPEKDNTVYQEIYPNIGTEKKLNYRTDVIEYLTGYGIEILNPKEITPNSKESTRKYFELYKTNRHKKHSKAIHQAFQYLNTKQGGSITPEIQELITAIDFTPNNSNYLMNREVEYLTANWLEDFAYYTIKHNLAIADKFIKRGVKINLQKTTTTNELDIIFIYNNTCHLVECKLGLKGSKGDAEIKDFFEKTAYKLGALKEQFGLTVKPYLFTLESRLRQDGKIKPVYEKRAAQQNIIILDRNILCTNSQLQIFFNGIK
jgi:hypothetical protein